MKLNSKLLSFILALTISSIAYPQCLKSNFFSLQSGTSKEKKQIVDSLLRYSATQYRVLNSNALKYDEFPLSVLPNGELEHTRANHWTSGFFPGSLWYLYESTNDPYFLEQAIIWTEKLESQKNNGRTHDIGFMIYCSYGNAYRITKKQKYKQVILDASKTLAGRFDPTVGCIRSWDWGQWKFPVIIDNMMNLEMLYFAAKESGNTEFATIATSHANKTLKNHFRNDYSCWHVVDYNPANGEVLSKSTHQGYSNESVWSRGVAWSVYGYLICYKATGNTTYLDQAKKVVNYILGHPQLHSDKIPYWDMLCPDIPKTFRDASSATIIASALANLYTITLDKTYLESCEKMVTSLASNDYLLKTVEKHGFLLDHSVGHIPKNLEVDAPLNYADYYFLETLTLLKKIYGDDTIK